MVLTIAVAVKYARVDRVSVASRTRYAGKPPRFGLNGSFS